MSSAPCHLAPPCVELQVLGRADGDCHGEETGHCPWLGRGSELGLLAEVDQHGRVKIGSQVTGIWVPILMWPPHSCVDKSPHLCGLQFPLL